MLSDPMFSSEVLALHSLIRETAKEPWYVAIIYFRVKPFFIIALVIGHTCYRGKMIFNIFFHFRQISSLVKKPTKFKIIETIPIKKNKSTEHTSYTDSQEIPHIDGILVNGTRLKFRFFYHRNFTF